MRAILTLLFFGIATTAVQASVLTIPDLTILAGSSTGVTFTLTGSFTTTDTIDAVVSGTVDLNNGNYTANAAGIVVAPPTTNTGTHPGQTDANTTDPSVPFAALLIGNSTLGFFPLFPADAADGLGSSTPPTNLTVSETVGSIFGAALPSGTVLTLKVSDCTSCFADNSGSFVTALASVPEPATFGSTALLLLSGLFVAQRRSRTRR